MLSTSEIKQKHCFKIETISLVQRIFWSYTEIPICTVSVNNCIVLIRTWGFVLSVPLPCNDVLIVTWYILFWLYADCKKTQQQLREVLSRTPNEISSHRKHLSVGPARHCRNILVVALHMCSIFPPAGGEVSMLSVSGVQFSATNYVLCI